MLVPPLSSTECPLFTAEGLLSSLTGTKSPSKSSSFYNPPAILALSEEILAPLLFFFISTTLGSLLMQTPDLFFLLIGHQAILLCCVATLNLSLECPSSSILTCHMFFDSPLVNPDLWQLCAHCLWALFC